MSRIGNAIFTKEMLKGFGLAVATALLLIAGYEARNAYWVIKQDIRLAIKWNQVVARNDKTGEVFTYEQVMDALLIRELQNTPKK